MFLKRLTYILLFSLIISCSSSLKQEHLVKLSFYNSLNTKQFSFVVSDEFLNNNESETDKKHPKMTKSEVKLLRGMLKKNNYCINKKSKLLFTITSKQKKIYDVTLSSLIGRQYNARPLTPVTYFGRCS